MGGLTGFRTDPGQGADRRLQREPTTRWLRSFRAVVPVVLAMMLSYAAPSQSIETSSPELEASPFAGDPFELHRLHQQAKDTQELYRLRIAIPEAVQAKVPMAWPLQPTFKPPAPASEGLGRYAWLVALLGVIGFFAARQLAPEFTEAVCTCLNPWAPPPPLPAEPTPQELTEQQAFNEFLVAFKSGPPLKRPAAAHESATEGKGDHSRTESDPVANFYANAPKHLLAMRNLLQEIGRGPLEAVRQKLLGDLCGEVGALKGTAGHSELLAAWQLAATLESLLKQLAAQASKVTPSTLRTVATGVDVLDRLSQPGLKKDLFIYPAFRFLVVDDDSISRHAVSFSLKKAFSQPDVAENGEAALALVAEHAYDAIFLDVMMPGMDGFEVCSKIHQTILNRTTPVVFVTCNNDFDARAKSSLCGGTDLLGKPFLTFEITLKALTLALRGRLPAPLVEAPKAPAESPATIPAPAVAEPHAAVA